MLVYLDTAHLSALPDLRRRDLPGFVEFLELLTETLCHVVVSRAHLHEIGQSAELDDVERKLETLRYIPLMVTPINENVDWIIVREIEAQTLLKLAGGATPSPSPYSHVREQLYLPGDWSAIREFVLRARPGLIAEMEYRRKLAEFQNLNLTLAKYLKTAARKQRKWAPDGWKFLPVSQAMAPQSSGDPVADKWMNEVAARLKECWKNANGERQTFICSYDLAGMAALDYCRTEDLLRLGFWRVLGRHWVAPHCRLAGYEDSAIVSALDAFNPYDAPGLSTVLAVERGRKRHDQEYKASDHMDTDHILWAVHADLAFIDRRTHGYLRQAQQTAALAKLLSPYKHARFERAANLGEVKRLIVEQSKS